MAYRSSAQATAGASPVVVNAPAGVAINDIILLAVVDYGNAITWPSGFSATLANFTTTGAHAGIANSWSCAWKLATASEPSTYSIAIAGGGGGLAAISVAFSGRASSPGSVVITNEAPGFSPPTSPFTVQLTGYTASAGDDVCVFIGNGSGSTAGTWATSNSIGYTTQQDISQAGAFTGGLLDLSTQNNLSAGATGVQTFTQTGVGVTRGGEGAGVIVPMPAANIGPPPVPAQGPMPRRKFILP